MLGLLKFAKKIKENSFEKLEKVLGQKPALEYFELNLVDHCNLNCKGCSHFSPIADKQFAELEIYKKDLAQLQTLFSTVKTIRLLGGEPLLHPQIEAFLSVTRSNFSKANIDIVTNGVLLHTLPDEFWVACKKLSVNIQVSMYPPLKGNELNLIKLASDKGVIIHMNSIASFHGFYNSKGDTELNASFKQCRSRFFCPMLREGKLYVCCLSSNITHFNKYFDLKIPNTGFADIYSPGISGWTVKERLDKPSPTCAYCTLGWKDIPMFPWAASTRSISDWTTPNNITPQNGEKT